MAVTNFPYGVASFGVPLIGASGGLIPTTTGQYFWVDSNGSGAGTQGSFKNPFTTLAAAYVACVASRGDVIIMKPGHAETTATNTALTFSKIGVTVVGLGTGSLRPTITLTGTTAAATIAVSAANQTFKNFIVSTGTDELVAAFTVSAAGCTLDGVDWVEASASYQAITFLTTTAAGDQLTVKNCNLTQITACAGNGFAITLTGADDCLILNNIIDWLGTDNAASGSIGMKTTACLRAKIIGNICTNLAGTTGVSILALAASTGIIAFNVANNPNGAGSIVGISGMGTFQNYAGTSGTTSGILDPTSGV